MKLNFNDKLQLCVQHRNIINLVFKKFPTMLTSFRIHQFNIYSSQIRKSYLQFSFITRTVSSIKSFYEQPGIP